MTLDTFFEHHLASSRVLFIVAVFAVVHYIYILRQLILSRIDLYDFLLLSTVSMLPVLFLWVPGLDRWLADLIGISFPFILLFSLLLLALFIICHQLIMTCHRLEGHNRLLIQEVSLLKARLDQLPLGPAGSPGPVGLPRGQGRHESDRTDMPSIPVGG